MEPAKKSIKFALPAESNKLSIDKLVYRKSQHPGINERDSKSSFISRSSKDDLDINTRQTRSVNFRETRDDITTPIRATTRITQMFRNVGIRRARSSAVILPIERYLPTYQMESKKPFDPRYVEDFLRKYVDFQIDNISKFHFDDPDKMNPLLRGFSEDILRQVKFFEFDRYKIFVSVTICEKRYQGFSQNVGVLWDIEQDSMATYVSERGHVFVLVNVFGVYHD